MIMAFGDQMVKSIKVRFLDVEKFKIQISINNQKKVSQYTYYSLSSQ